MAHGNPTCNLQTGNSPPCIPSTKAMTKTRLTLPLTGVSFKICAISRVLLTLKNFRLASTPLWCASCMYMAIIQHCSQTLVSPPVPYTIHPPFPNVLLFHKNTVWHPRAVLFKTFNKSLALSNLHNSTLDYHIRNSLHQVHTDPLVYPLPHMTTLLHKSHECAYRNLIKISKANGTYVKCTSALMIAFITCNSNLVPLLESLCNSNTCRFEFSGFQGFCRNRTFDNLS